MAYEITILQSLMIINLFLFTTTLNLIILWYLAGVYLTLLGLFLFLNDGDIFVGFLWVIDLGVGLIFFIFILHYSNFLHQKSILNKNSREITLSFLFLLFILSFYIMVLYPLDNNFMTGVNKTWFFLISWIDYYLVSSLPNVTDLNLLHEIFFVNNSLEFIFINFFLFYGIISSILLAFLIKYIFTKLTLPHYTNLSFMNYTSSVFFIRNQDFLKQQSASAGERVWVKQRFLNL